jgi:hypothetical protein
VTLAERIMVGGDPSDTNADIMSLSAHEMVLPSLANTCPTLMASNLEAMKPEECSGWTKCDILCSGMPKGLLLKSCGKAVVVRKRGSKVLSFVCDGKVVESVMILFYSRLISARAAQTYAPVLTT